MAIKTNIAWCQHTASPWFGCSEVPGAPECAHCYAKLLTLRSKWAGWGDNSPRVKSKGFWKEVPKWNDAAAGLAEKPRIFTSLMDFLDVQAPLALFGEFMNCVRVYKSLNWLLLTKRIEHFKPRMVALMNSIGPTTFFGNDTTTDLQKWISDWLNGNPPDNVWLGVTAGVQKRADEQIPILLSTPAKVHWVSAEPLLEEVKLPSIEKLSWVVIGGESGPNFRRVPIRTICQLAEDCIAAKVRVFVKQDCNRLPGLQGLIPPAYWDLKQFPV